MATGRPDWFGTIVSAGKYNSTFVPIAVDEHGNLVSLMQGEYGTVLKTIAVDEDGVMLANLSAQDLSFLKTKPAYGGAVREITTTWAISGEECECANIDGRGVVYAGILIWNGPPSLKGMEIRVAVDGNYVETQTPLQLMDWGIYDPAQFVLFPILYDDDNFKYVQGIKPGLTFESNITITCKHMTGATEYVDLRLIYALVA